MGAQRRTPVDTAIGVIIREALASKGVRQMDLAEGIGCTQAHISRRLSGWGPPFSDEQLAEVCAFLGLEVSEVKREARRKTGPVVLDQPPSADEHDDPAHDQCRAFGLVLARQIWEHAGDKEFISAFTLHEEFNMRTNAFWNRDRLLLASRFALDYLAQGLSKRYPVRDSLPFEETMPPNEMIMT